mgnify:CR=1 FL=1
MITVLSEKYDKVIRALCRKIKKTSKAVMCAQTLAEAIRKQRL